MFGNPGRAQFGRREPAAMPSFNSGHRQYQPPAPASYRTQQPSFDEDDDEWDDDSDEEVYENEQQMTSEPPGRRDRQPPPPSRPPFNPPVDQRPMRPPPTNYPLHRPNNMDPPPIQPRDNPPDDANDDFYMPIDPSQEAGRGPPMPSFPRPNTGYSPAHAPVSIPPSRPSFPPPSSSGGGRPPMPTPQTNPMFDMGAGIDKPPRIDRNPPPGRTSRSNRTSPRSSPGPPSRDNSGRSSGSRQPQRGGSTGSRSSQDSNSSGDHRLGGARGFVPPVPTESPSRSGGFEMFKKPPGFEATLNPPNLPNKPKGGLPQLSRSKPDVPAKVTSGFASFDRKPKPIPMFGKQPPRKEKSTAEVGNELAERFSKIRPRPAETSPVCGPDFNHAIARPQLSSFPKRVVPVEQQHWFRDVSRNEAQVMIERSRPQDGCFLVRPGRAPNPYSLTVFSGTMCNLVIRRRSDNNYALGNEKANEKSFPSVVELIQYHMGNPLVLAEGKGEVRLIGPP